MRLLLIKNIDLVLVVDFDVGLPAPKKKDRRNKSEELTAYQQKLAIKREKADQNKKSLIKKDINLRFASKNKSL